MLKNKEKNNCKHKAFKFRIYPNREQKQYFSNVFGCCRFTYNKMLESKLNAYKETGEIINPTPAQYKEEFTFLKEVDSYALCNEQLFLNKAFKTFFNHQNSFPKFKSKKKDRDSYITNNVNNNIKISTDNRYISFCKVKNLRIKCHRQIPSNYKIKSLTISRTPTNKFYCSILCEYIDNEVKEINLNKSIGLDYSSPYFYIDSNGNKGNCPKYTYKYQHKLTREQRKLSKMKLGSNNYKKQKLKVALIYEKITNSRKDYLNKLSRTLTNKYDIVCIEDLSIKGISRSLKLAKTTLDNSWSYFVNKLQEKCKLVQKVDKFYPSSKTCNYCGFINKELTLQDREWECPNCHHIIARDVNAAKNILDEGLKIVYTNYKNRRDCGDSSLILLSIDNLSERPLTLVNW